MISTRDGIDWARAQAFAQAEREVFTRANPTSAALAERANQHLLFGVPLHWMRDWGTPFALHVAHASGAHRTLRQSGRADRHRQVPHHLIKSL